MQRVWAWFELGLSWGWASGEFFYFSCSVWATERFRGAFEGFLLGYWWFPFPNIHFFLAQFRLLPMILSVQKWLCGETLCCWNAKGFEILWKILLNCFLLSMFFCEEHVHSYVEKSFCKRNSIERCLFQFELCLSCVWVVFELGLRCLLFSIESAHKECFFSNVKNDIKWPSRGFGWFWGFFLFFWC